MNTAKHRERKCSTCRHYQPSPLWRKGWCRNPLLYDRNTNHLVEADSLSCNRTFIDYWEPVEGPAQQHGPQVRAPKPRIAPSIPMNTVDAKGRRNVVTGNTPAEGMGAVVTQRGSNLATKRERPALALITPDYEEEVDGATDPKTTRQFEQIEGPEAAAASAKASERIKKARAGRNPSLFGISGMPLYLGLAVLLAIGLLLGVMYASNRSQQNNLAAKPVATMTAPLPTPTGFGDPTATSAVPPTQPPAPPANVIAVGGFVEVQGSRTGLTVRSQPARSGRRLTVIPDGTRAKVIEGPQEADGFTWWKLEGYDSKDPSLSGWSAGQFLVPVPPPAP